MPTIGILFAGDRHAHLAHVGHAVLSQPRFSANRACTVTGHHVGLVPALLGAGETSDNRLGHVVLLMHMQPISYIAAIMAETTLSTADLRGLRIHLVADAGAALLVLLAVTALSVYKPRGMTRYGRRKQHEQLTESEA
jgi:hypothetical protein